MPDPRAWVVALRDDLSVGFGFSWVAHCFESPRVMKPLDLTTPHLGQMAIKIMMSSLFIEVNGLRRLGGPCEAGSVEARFVCCDYPVQTKV